MTKLDFGAYTREELKAFANGGYTVIIPSCRNGAAWSSSARLYGYDDL